jgi:hypothetical protein
MKINRLEAHDRLQYLIKDQSLNIFQGAEDCMKRNPLSLAIQEKSPYIYLFAHPRTADDGVNKIMYWQPRLSIPEPQTNSYLFRAISKTDLIETCWLIPPQEMWKQYQKGNVTENEIVVWSINQYKTKREELAQPHPDDMPQERGRRILKEIVDDHRASLKMKVKPKILEPYLIS